MCQMKMCQMKTIVLFFLCLFPFMEQVQAQSKSNVEQDTTVAESQLGKGIKLGDVEVLGVRKHYGVESAQMSAIRITPLQIKQTPSFMGEIDVLKALQKLPGVNSEGEGSVGISVRGGGFDQNLISLDGATLYNPEHLKGYASAINPDMVSGIDFYRGAFPARYGSRLSSIVDVSMREGNYERVHGSLHLGMLTGSVNLEGPLSKGRTSFIIGGRMSYFDLFAYKALEKVYDSDGIQPYSKMKYVDLNAKITHKFNPKSKLSATFYYGKDTDKSTPTKSEYRDTTHLRIVDKEDWYKNPILHHDYTLNQYLILYTMYNSAVRVDSTYNEWSNTCASLNWDWDLSRKVSLGLTAAYSKYDYKLEQWNTYSTMKENAYWSYMIYSLEWRRPREAHELKQNEKTYQGSFSRIEDLSLEANLNWRIGKKNNLLVGVRGAIQNFTPQIKTKNEFYYGGMRQYPGGAGWYIYETKSKSESNIENDLDVKQYAFYLEDIYDVSKSLRLNVGLRYALHSVTGKTYSSLEPRAAIRWKLFDKHALKMAYSRMAQSSHRLLTNDLKTSVEMWIPITKDIPLATSDLGSVGYVYEPIPGMCISLEGYYKTVENILDYNENSNYHAKNLNWYDLVAVGDSKIYGAELLVEKTTGKTTGWLSYTWSKSLCKFDEPGNRLNGGDSFYSSNDRRNNLSAMLMHRIDLSEKSRVELSAAWTYQTGRRVTLPTNGFYAGTFGYFDGLGNHEVSDYEYNEGWYDTTMDNQHGFDKITSAISSKGKNDYVLPAIHHLDIGANYVYKHTRGESVLGFSIYNVYNRMNVSSAYVGVNEEGKMVLKCQCPFPIMPSFSYTRKF